MMSLRPENHREIKFYRNYKLSLKLTNGILSIKLYSNQKSSIYYQANVQFSDIPQNFTLLFNNLEQLYCQFKEMSESQFSFDQQTCEFKYIVTLLSKSVEMPIKMQQMQLSRIHQLQLDKLELEKRERQNLETIGDQGRQLEELKKMKTEIEAILKKYQMSSLAQLDVFLKETVKYGDIVFFSENAGQSNKKSVQLPSTGFFKNNEGKHQRLQKKQCEFFLFSPVYSAQISGKYTFGETRQLKLIRSCQTKDGFFTIQAKHPINVIGRTIIGVKNLKQMSTSQGVIVGLRCPGDESNSQEDNTLEYSQVSYNQLSYNLKTGSFTTNMDGTEMVDSLMPIGEKETLHMTVHIQNKILEFYRNQILMKQLSLVAPFANCALKVFVKLSTAGEEIQLL